MNTSLSNSRRLFIAFTAVTMWLACVGSASAQQPRKPSVPPGVTVSKNLEYVTHGHERNKLDVYVPDKAEGRLPLVVWIHGGAWKAGSKEGGPAMGLVKQGYVVASINYRYSQQAVFPAQIEDCKAAIRWLRAHAAEYHIDPARVGAWGASAGGHLVAMLDVTGDTKEFDVGENLDQSSQVQCVVDWFGPTDMVTIQVGGDTSNSPITQLIGGPVSDNKEKAQKASPITFVSKTSAPILIMHGDKDPLVPLSQSERFAAALNKAGVDVMFKIIEGNGHGGPGFGTPESRKLIQDFFAKHLKDGKKRP
jgi:acetyl esterase/lipase